MDHICYLCCVFVCHTDLSIPCNPVVTCLEMADLLAFLNVMFSCVLVTLPYVILGLVWSLIVSIPDVCLLPYFHLPRL